MAVPKILHCPWKYEFKYKPVEDRYKSDERNQYEGRGRNE